MVMILELNIGFESVAGHQLSDGYLETSFHLALCFYGSVLISCPLIYTAFWGTVLKNVCLSLAGHFPLSAPSDQWGKSIFHILKDIGQHSGLTIKRFTFLEWKVRGAPATLVKNVIFI